MKKHLVFTNMLVGSLILVAAYQAPNPFWQNVGINLGTAFISIAIGIIVVNVYLDRDSRKGAIKSIFILGNKNIAAYHNLFLDEMWGLFGKKEFEAIYTAYVSNKMDILVIHPQQRQMIYDRVKAIQADLNPIIATMDAALGELTNLIKWDLDAHLLEFILDARSVISQYRSRKFDDTTNSINAIVGYLFMIDLLTQTARQRLKEIGGIHEGQ